MSVGATLKVALAANAITVGQLVGMRERDALRLPWVGPKVWAEAKRQTSKRGGARVGAGRVATDGATGLGPVAFRLTGPQKAKVARMGGSVWVRKVIDEAVD